MAENEPIDADFVESPEAAPSAPLAVKEQAGLAQGRNDLARPADVEAAVQRANAQIEFRRRLTQLIATKIDPAHIVMYGSGDKATAYFTKAACQSILGWIEADFYPDTLMQELRYTGKDGPYIIFELSGELRLPSRRRVRVTGNRATNDDFFGKAHGAAVPLEEVDIASVRLAAITNLWNHALEAAGFKPSLKDLIDAGIDPKQLATVEFKRGDKQAPQSAHAAASGGAAPAAGGGSAGAELISDAQSKRLFGIAMGSQWDTKQYRDALQNKFGFSSDKAITRAKYDEVVAYFQKGPGRP